MVAPSEVSLAMRIFQQIFVAHHTRFIEHCKKEFDEMFEGDHDEAIKGMSVDTIKSDASTWFEFMENGEHGHLWMLGIHGYMFKLDAGGWHSKDESGKEVNIYDMEIEDYKQFMALHSKLLQITQHVQEPMSPKRSRWRRNSLHGTPERLVTESQGIVDIVLEEWNQP